MPNKLLASYLVSLGSDKLLRYQGMDKEKNVHEGINFHYDHQGVFKTPDGKVYHNLQVQLSKGAKAKSLKAVSRTNGTSPSASCVLVAKAWDGPWEVLSAAFEESNALGNDDGCRKVWLFEDGTTKPEGDAPSKSEKAAEERKIAKENKKAGDARRKEKRN